MKHQRPAAAAPGGLNPLGTPIPSGGLNPPGWFGLAGKTSAPGGPAAPDQPAVPGWRPFARRLRRVLTALPGRWRLAGAPPLPGPCVYVVHHQNLAGPLAALTLLPGEPRPWVLQVFCGRRACFAQYYHYTFTRRFGLPRPLALPAAGLCALLVPGLVNGVGAIPVWRGARGGLRSTWRRSCAALAAGQSLIVCPDIDYASPSPATGAIYRGFFALGQEQQRRGGPPLPFVPAVCDKAGRRLVLGEPVTLRPGQPLARQKAEAAALLTARLNALAAAFAPAPAPAPSRPRPQGGPLPG